MKTITYYSKIWYWHALSALQVTFANRATNSLFFLGKFLRLTMSLLFLFILHNSIKTFGEYTSNQMVIFFLVYLWIDTITQSLFRGVYSFGSQVRQGSFDFDLTKPINPLFKALMGEPDINDVIFLIPSAFATLWALHTFSIQLGGWQILLFGLLFINSLVIATALHIVVLSLAILTTDIDGIMWMYRDLLKLGQFPVTAYGEALRFTLFFLVPVGMMITIPAQVLLNLTPSYAIWLTLIISGTTFGASLLLWRYCLRHYTSASS